MVGVSTVPTTNGLAATPPTVSFRAGGVDLEPQNLPDFLVPYHARSLELTESALADPSLRCTRAVRYGPNEHQRLDVWTSSSSDDGAPRPVVVFLHGGGWDWGYREWVGFCARNICRDNQAIMIAPSYALGKGASRAWPESRDDVVEVLRWIARGGGRTTTTRDEGDGDPDNSVTAMAHGDPSRIVLAGHSAGGHLAACVGLDPALLRQHRIDPHTVRALFLVSCPLGIRPEDFFPALSQRRWLWKPLGWLARFLYDRSIRRVLRPVLGAGGGGNAGEDDEHHHPRRLAQDASPLFWVANPTTTPPPVWPYVHYSYASKKDFFICRPHSKILKNILERRGDDAPPNKMEILEMTGVEGHFDSHFSLDDPTSEWHDALSRILADLN